MRAFVQTMLKVKTTSCTFPYCYVRLFARVHKVTIGRTLRGCRLAPRLW